MYGRNPAIASNGLVLSRAGRNEGPEAVFGVISGRAAKGLRPGTFSASFRDGPEGRTPNDGPAGAGEVLP